MRVLGPSITLLCLGLGILAFVFFWKAKQVDASLERWDQPPVVSELKANPRSNTDLEIVGSKVSQETIKAAPIENDSKDVDVSQSQEGEVSSSTRLLTATLLPSENVFPFQAKIGLAEVNDQDYGDFLEDKNDKVTAPRDLSELANITHWIDAPLSRQESGQWKIGPVGVPAADLYRVFAWGEHGYFLHDFVPLEKAAVGPQFVGLIQATPFTGLDVRLANHRGKPYYLTFHRDPKPNGNDEDSVIATVMKIISPKIRKAYSGKPIEITQGGAIFTPMYPDPTVRLRLLTRSGTMSEPVSLSLNRNRVRTFTLDIDELFEPERPPIDLNGRLVFSTGDPVEGGIIERKGPFHQSRRTGNDGMFFFEDLSSGRATHFKIKIPRPSEGRPLAGYQHRFVFDPASVEGRTTSVEWIIPAFRWLVLGLDEEERDRMDNESPYPVYLLQMEESGEWVDIPAEEFFPQKDGMAISLTRQGTFRGVVAFSAVHYAYSNPVVITLKDQEVYIPMALEGIEDPNTYTVTCLDGEGSVSVPIRIIGDHTSLPPFELMTDESGRVQFKANSKSLMITVSGMEYEIHIKALKDLEIEINIGDSPK